MKKDVCLISACTWAAISLVLGIVGMGESGTVARNFTAAFFVCAVIAAVFWLIWLVSEESTKRPSASYNGKYSRLKRRTRAQLKTTKTGIERKRVYNAFLLAGEGCGIDRAQLERDFDKIARGTK